MLRQQRCAVPTFVKMYFTNNSKGKNIMQITVEKIKVSGGYRLSTLIFGSLYQMVYYGYTKKESLLKFRMSAKSALRNTNRL